MSSSRIAAYRIYKFENVRQPRSEMQDSNVRRPVSWQDFYY